MAKKSIDVEAQSVTFDFGDGRVETFKLAGMSDEMKIQLALHGASQKIGDSYASAKAQTDGTEIDPADWSQQQSAGVIAQLLADDWTVRSVGGATETDLMVAFAQVTGKDLVADLDKDQKAALRKHPKIAAVLARIKSERADAKAAASAKAAEGHDTESLEDFAAA